MARITKPSTTKAAPVKNKIQDEINNSIVGSNDSDRRDGGVGNDSLYGAHGDDTLIGGTGKDKIWGGHGNDYLIGGSSNKPNDREADVFYFEASDGEQRDTIAGFDKGIDKINLSLRPDDTYRISNYDDRSVIVYDLAIPGPGVHGKQVQINVLGVKLDASDIISNVKQYVPQPDVSKTASQGNDSIVGTLGDDQIDGLGGNDSIYGNHGNDTLIGGAGADKIWGGNGSDYLIGGSSARLNDRQADVFFFAKSDGEQNDTIEGFDKGIDKINLSFGASESYSIRYDDKGNSQIVYDVVNGGNGPHDAVAPGPGIKIGTGTITVLNARIEAKDIISDAKGSMPSKGFYTNEKLGSSGNDSIIGRNWEDTIKGLAGNDSLYGGHGNDTLVGGTGKDQIWGGHGGDVMYGGAEHNAGYKDGQSDTFYFMKSDGTATDVIYGFEVGIDKLKFDTGASFNYDGKDTTVSYAALNEAGLTEIAQVVVVNAHLNSTDFLRPDDWP